MRLRSIRVGYAVVAHLLISAASLSATAQIHTNSASSSEYEWRNPLPQGNYLRACAQIDTQNVIAVGDAGTVLVTTDGGATWSFQSSGVVTHLYDVCFPDKLTGTVVGADGTVLRTTDAGTVWSPQISGTPNDLYAVCFTDVMTGTAVGGAGTIIRTIDGGDTWSDQTSGTTADLSDVCFTDSHNGTAVGRDGTILRTVDGGSNWTAQVSGTDGDLYGTAFTDSLTGVAVGEGYGFEDFWGELLRTTDGGATWTTQLTTWEKSLKDAEFTDSLTGFIIGSGILLTTVDGGATWTDPTGGSTPGASSISFADSLVGTAVGWAGEIKQTVDGGSSWTSRKHSNGFDYTVQSICFTDGLTGVAVGARTILRTTDGGRTWTIQEESSDAVAFLDVDFADALNGSVVGIGGRTVRTTDGGINWEWIDAGTSARLNGVSFGTASTGAAGGWMSTFIRTVDAGATWEVIAPPTVSGVEDVFMFDATDGVAVERTGNVLLTDNAWASWSTRSIGGTLHGIHFANRSTGWVVGGDGIQKSIDGGMTWSNQTGDLDQTPYGVAFQDVSTGTVVGRRGLLLRTTDGGDNWTRHFVTANSLYGVAKNGTVGGDVGTILGLDVEVATQITGLYAKPNRGFVELVWDISSDDVVLGFRLLRSDTANRMVPLTHGLIDPTARSFLDRGIEPGREYEYTLVVVLQSLVEIRSVPIRVSTGSPALELGQNYPNPFNPTTSIEYFVPKRMNVSLEVYDVAGHLVKRLATGVHEAGRYSAEWNGTNKNGAPVGTGVYVYRLTAGKQVISKKMTMLK